MAGKLSAGDKVALVNSAGEIVATLDISDVFPWDKQKYLSSVYLTDNNEHPGGDMVLKGDADMVIDTSNLSAHDLREKIRTTFLGVEKQRDMVVTVTSFGYKYGMPVDADIVMDVRFLPNPHYIEELRYFHGGEEPVKNFVLSQKITGEFISKFFDLLDFLLGNYKKEGKTYLNLALGCTGGTHRSVTLAESTAEFLREKGYSIIIRHRDVGKDFKRL